MPLKKPPPRNEKPQSERFIEAARKIEASESPGAFDDAFKKVVPQRPLKVASNQKTDE